MDVDSKDLAVFISNFHNKTTFAHEIAHVLGLAHSFCEKKVLTQMELNDLNDYVIEVNNELCYMLSNNYTRIEIKEYWDSKKKDFRVVNGYLNVHYRNPFKFEQSKTDNFMDYDNDRKIFWKFQWKAFQDDIRKVL